MTKIETETVLEIYILTHASSHKRRYGARDEKKKIPMRAATSDVTERVRGAKAAHLVLRPTAIPVAFRPPTRDTGTLWCARTAMGQESGRGCGNGGMGGGWGEGAGWGSVACEVLQTQRAVAQGKTALPSRRRWRPLPGEGSGWVLGPDAGTEAGKGRDLLKKPSVGAACMSRTATSAKSAGTIPRIMLTITNATGVRLTWLTQLVVSCGRQVACRHCEALFAWRRTQHGPPRGGAAEEFRAAQQDNRPRLIGLLSACVPRYGCTPRSGT